MSRTVTVSKEQRRPLQILHVTRNFHKTISAFIRVFQPTFTCLLLFLPALQILAILEMLRVNSNLPMEAEKGKTKTFALVATLANAILKAFQQRTRETGNEISARAPVLLIQISKMADFVNRPTQMFFGVTCHLSFRRRHAL